MCESCERNPSEQQPNLHIFFQSPTYGFNQNRLLWPCPFAFALFLVWCFVGSRIFMCRRQDLIFILPPMSAEKSYDPFISAPTLIRSSLAVLIQRDVSRGLLKDYFISPSCSCSNGFNVPHHQFRMKQLELSRRLCSLFFLLLNLLLIQLLHPASILFLKAVFMYTVSRIVQTHSCALFKNLCKSELWLCSASWNTLLHRLRVDPDLGRSAVVQAERLVATCKQFSCSFWAGILSSHGSLSLQNYFLCSDLHPCLWNLSRVEIKHNQLV